MGDRMTQWVIAVSKCQSEVLFLAGASLSKNLGDAHLYFYHQMASWLSAMKSNKICLVRQVNGASPIKNSKLP